MTSSLTESPFFLLKASVRDSRASLIEKAEERSLVIDAKACNDARTVLSTPRLRLAAELGWLPGIAPERALALCQIAQNEALPMAEMRSIPGLAACNVLSTWLATEKQHHDDEIAVALEALSERYDSIDTEQLYLTLNEDREAAGFPQVPSVEVVNELLHERRQGLLRAMRDGLALVSMPDAVLAAVIRRQTQAAGSGLPPLLSDLIGQYEAGTLQHLGRLRSHIELYCSTMAEILKKNPDSDISSEFEALESLIKLWEQLAKPLLLACRSRGIDEPNSVAVAQSIRGLAIDLANEKNLFDVAQRLTKLQQKYFSELALLGEQIDADAATLDNLKAQQSEAESADKAWRASITQAIEIGPHVLQSSPEGISFKQKSFALADVEGVRWGIFNRYLNGICVERKYTVWIFAKNDVTEIECAKLFESGTRVQARYSEVIQLLWGTVMVRLIREMLDALTSSGSVHVGSVEVTRNGVVLPDRRLFGRNAPSVCTWTNLHWQSVSGSLRLVSKEDKKRYVDLPYRDITNVHVLEAMLNILTKDNNLQKLQSGDRTWY